MYTLNNFIRNISPEMLQNYCKAENLDFTCEKDEEPKELAENFSSFLATLSKKTKANIELQFQEIAEIVSEKGTLMLIQELKARNEKLPEDIENYSNQDKAMWFYLNQQPIFNQVLIEYEIEYKAGWTRYTIQSNLKKEALEKTQELAKQIGKFYVETENRGHISQGERIDKDNYICYVTYLQDYIDREISYDDNKQLNKSNYRQPVFTIFLLYNPKENRIAIKAKGGKEIKEEVIKIFAKTIFNEEISEKNKIVYDLNVLKNFNHPFDREISDKVEAVKVVELRLSYPKAFGRSMILRVNKNGEGMKDMGDFINSSHIPIEKMNITQAKIRVKFKPELKREKGTVTALITSPNSCNLGEQKNHKKVQQYLKDWGIDSNEV